MNESQFTRELFELVRRKLSNLYDPPPVIFKHADRWTKGIPDVSITMNGKTTWYEVKLTTNKRIFEPIQVQTMLRLQSSFYVIWNVKKRTGCLLSSESRGDFYDFDLDSASFTKQEVANMISRICFAQ